MVLILVILLNLYNIKCQGLKPLREVMIRILMDYSQVLNLNVSIRKLLFSNFYPLKYYGSGNVKNRLNEN